MGQLDLLDYTSSLEPSPVLLLPEVLECELPTPLIPKAKKTTAIARPLQPNAELIDTSASSRDEVPYQIGDFVKALPRPTAAKDVATTTSFKGRTGIVVRVDPAHRRCWVHFGIPNHPSPESWDHLAYSTARPNLWPNPVDAAPPLLTWKEWRWHANQACWHYTGSMGIDDCWGIGHDIQLFPVDIDPNRIGVLL